MKYLVLLFLFLGGCATTKNSEYWHGCVDASNFLTHNEIPPNEVKGFCDAVEQDHKQQVHDNQFSTYGKK